MTQLPKSGRTVYAHVDRSLSDATATLIGVRRAILAQTKLSPKKRTQLSQDLAGVVSDVESIRLWLEGGAPR